jgi:hypothetical protein
MPFKMWCSFKGLWALREREWEKIATSPSTFRVVITKVKGKMIAYSRICRDAMPIAVFLFACNEITLIKQV